MKKNIFIGVGVVAIVVVSFYLFSTERATAPETEVPAITVVTEEIETPETIEIATGTPPESTEETPKKTTTTKTEPKTTTPKQTSAPIQESETEPAIPLPYTVTVIYNGGRFIPDEVTIIEGGTVRFMNTSNQPMWIASDNHPTHTRYPLRDESTCSGQVFDQCASIGTESSWSFVFTRKGTWGYHNHERAQDTGKVRVLSEEAYLEEVDDRIPLR